MLLTLVRHIRNADGANHDYRPYLFRERLDGDEFPELPLGHDDFRYAVVQNPAVEGREANLLAIGEHRIRYGLFHALVSFIVGPAHSNRDLRRRPTYKPRNVANELSY